MTDAHEPSQPTQAQRTDKPHRDDERQRSQRLDGEYDPAIEQQWQDYWLTHDTYSTDATETANADTRFTIDTPPPTVSGDLHMGHLYQYTVPDFAARFHRMRDDAVFVHPDDDGRSHLVGEQAIVPLFGHEVPILEDERVDRETGTGVVMCCTFGDATDVEWYHAHDLPLRAAIDASATMTELAGQYAGLSAMDARESIVTDLDEQGRLIDHHPIAHTIQVHERCETGIEFQVTEQWYVKILDRTGTYLEAGREIEWYPEKMFTRYRNWIEGLEWDWCISRQRDSGIPFPVWYCADCGHAILAERAQLPIDPLTDEPPVDCCPRCDHDAFTPETDVFDTWATSSLTPLINAGWDGDTTGTTFDHPERYPMSLRPQGHDIISTWLFHTIVKCYEHTGEVPFESVVITGMVLDANREAMSSSRGNVVTPDAVLERYPVDAARYWAAGASVGDDIPFTEGDLEAGERLLRKLWNASKLIERIAFDYSDEPKELAAIDRWLLARLDETIASVTEKLAAYEFSKARDELRVFFWHAFCDDYLEIAKHRNDASTAYTLRLAHRTFLTLFAPFLAHITEEIWQQLYSSESIHTTGWPEPRGYDADLAAGATAMEIISALRQYKNEHGLALSAPLDRVEIHGEIEGFEDAISDVMHVRELTVLDRMPAVRTEIADISLAYETLGPRYGNRLGDIEAAIESGAFEYDGETLSVAGVTLEPGTFEIETERTHSGDGTMLETESAVVVVE